MLKNYNIVCVTPAGRRRYMQLLIPQVLSSEIIDRYDIWLNTTDPYDLAFFQKISGISNKIRLLEQPDGEVDGNNSINAFFRHAIDEDTIYIRLDDDVIWIETEFFEKIIKFRIDNPQYFIVSPLVINNAVCSHILQARGKLKYPLYIRANAGDKTGWSNAKFALKLHKWFINKLENDTFKELYCGVKPIALNRFSINAICWFGRTFKQFRGIVIDTDEEFLTVTKPLEIEGVNCLYCETIVSHFAFYTQRRFLDNTHILEQYSKAIKKTYSKNKDFQKIAEAVKDVLQQIESDPSINRKKSLKSKDIKTWLVKIKVPVITAKSLGEINKNLKLLKKIRKQKVL
jgi:hypothetical protein